MTATSADEHPLDELPHETCEPETPRVRVVGVFCSAQTTNPLHISLAKELGTELARRGHTLVTGGGRVSSMGALARAARDGGAHTIGITVNVPMFDGLADDEASEVVVASDLSNRKREMIRRSDAFVVMPGGIGTLDEVLEVLAGRAIGVHHKPLVVLDPDGVFAPFRAQLELLQALGFLSAEVHQHVRWARSPDEALNLLESRKLS